MLRNEIIIINTSMPLKNYMKRRPTHYAEILSRSNRVINISSASIRHYSRFTNSCSWEEKIFFRLPGTRFRIIQKLNRWLYGIFFLRVVKCLPQKPILWYFYSGNYDIVKSLPNKISILEICDDTPEFFADKSEIYKEVKQNEDKMTEMVDIVFTVSDHLKQKKTALRPDIKVIRNGVVFEDFADTPTLPHNPTDELFNLKGPVVGYCGAVAKWFDFDLVEVVANKLRDVHFVFLGRISPDKQPIVARLNGKPNIHFLGEKPYDQLPHYLKYFELAHIPFIINELVAGVNPIKFYEYLAAGKRIVATPFPEIVLYHRNGVVESASGVEEYGQVIKRMLDRKAGDYTKACQDIAKENSWEARVEMACKIIEQKMEEIL